MVPWGGLCERRARPADPTTARLERMCGPKCDAQTGVHGPGHDAGFPGLDRDILDDEDSEEESEGRSSVAQPQEFTPPAPRALGSLVSEHRREDVGPPARSCILRC
jgi:hypothetical protein